MRQRQRMKDIGPFFEVSAVGADFPGLPSAASGVDLSWLLANAPKIGVYTPWAVQQGDLSWEEVVTPSTNVALFELGPVLSYSASLGFGAPGYVAILTQAPLTLSMAAAAYAGTPYKLSSAMAVYAQDVAGPSYGWKLAFLYWGSQRDPGDQAGGSGAVETAAGSVGGKLVFAQDVPAQQTTVKAAPLPGAFETAYETLTKQDIQVIVPGASGPLPPPPAPLPGPTPGPAPAPPGPSPGPPAPPEKASLVAPVLVGLGTAILGFLALRKKK